MEIEKKEKIDLSKKDIARRRIFILGVILVLVMLILILIEVFDLFSNTLGH
ncbi:MAG: hypothetical protein MJ239_00485 [Bacilli bacterium]|nr:hypothetical protein [Bacilli bacterium]